MKIALTILASLSLYGFGFGEEAVPDRASRVLKGIPTIKNNEHRNVVFKRLGLIADIRNKSIKLLDSDEHWGVASKIWSISDNEHWVLVEAYQPFQLKKDGKTFKRGVIYGKLLSLQIYYQADRRIKLDLAKVKPMYPYYKFGKVYTKKDNAPKK